MNIKAIVILILTAFTGLNSNAQTVLSGDFESDSYFTTFEGTWQIIKTNTGFKVKLGEDFKAKKAPDLKIFLSKLSYDDIDADNAADPKTSVLIAKLTKYKGEMEYEFPTDTNPDDFKSIVIHCVKYTKLWGGASLK